MVGFVQGIVLEVFQTGKNTSSVVVWSQSSPTAPGVGISVVVTAHTAALFTDGQMASLWTYLVHSENDHYLLGFTIKEKLRYFLRLLDVQGVGPKTGLFIIDSLGVEGLQSAIREQSIEAITKVPGIGKKTAAKIILELSQELPSVKSLVGNASSIDEFADVIATLRKLGYSAVAAREAVTAAAPLLAQQGEKTTAEKVQLILQQK